MPSILNLKRDVEPRVPEPEFISAPGAAQELVEFEIVVGRRQIASTALVAIVLLAVFSGVSYLIGRSMASTAEAAVIPAPVAAPVVRLPVAPVAPPPSVPAPEPIVAIKPPSTAPVFGDAIAGKVYLQVGAIEKGLAGIWAEGLRTHGLDAFVTAGPDDKQWRVVIGPLPDPQAFQRAKEILDALGVNTFGRRYQP
jgi:hypothetical protein